jgi:hypothetical protein
VQCTAVSKHGGLTVVGTFTVSRSATYCRRRRLPHSCCGKSLVSESANRNTDVQPRACTSVNRSSNDESELIPLYTLDNADSHGFGKSRRDPPPRPTVRPADGLPTTKSRGGRRIAHRLFLDAGNRWFEPWRQPHRRRLPTHSPDATDVFAKTCELGD